MIHPGGRTIVHPKRVRLKRVISKSNSDLDYPGANRKNRDSHPEMSRRNADRTRD
jgi:hypothetical protein